MNTCNNNRKLQQGKTEKACSSVALVIMHLGNEGMPHYHDNITEIYMLSKGEGSIIINGVEHEVKAGDGYVIPPNNKHLIHANSNMEFVCICNPPWTEEHEFPVDKNSFINNSKIVK